MTHLLAKRWPVLLLIAGCSAFAWAFTQVVDQARDDKAQELTLQMAPFESNASVNLELTTQLGTLPEANALPAASTTPALWWPALLFALAFCAGWFFRHGQRTTVTSRSEDVQPTEQTADDAAIDSGSNPPALTESAIRKITTIPDLTLDFPWDEQALDGMASLTPDERIARLEKQNASKAEIIKALEKLVTENREKWLHQDETEARLNHHINELSEDLRVAIFQLQRLQDDTQVRKILNPSDMA